MGLHRLVLLGSGNFAREVLWAASEVPENGRDWEIGGFLDDFPPEAKARLSRYKIDYPVLGTIASYQPQPGDCFLPAVGSPQTKAYMCQKIKERNGRFINLIHPSAHVAPTAVLGEGIIIGHGALISVYTKICDFAAVFGGSIVGHDCVIGEGATISAHCDVNGYAVVGKGAFLGSHAVLLPHAKVGEFATVGAGSVVLKKVRPGETVFGVPAKPLPI